MDLENSEGVLSYDKLFSNSDDDSPSDSSYDLFLNWHKDERFSTEILLDLENSKRAKLANENLEDSDDDSCSSNSSYDLFLNWHTDEKDIAEIFSEGVPKKNNDVFLKWFPAHYARDFRSDYRPSKNFYYSDFSNYSFSEDDSDKYIIGITTNFNSNDESFLLKKRNENELRIHARVTCRINDFLNKSIHQPGETEKIEYWGRNELIEKGCLIEIFPNGRRQEDEDFVSIILHNITGTNDVFERCTENYEFFAGKAIISVIDALKNEKYKRLYEMSSPMLKSELLKINKYVSRARLEAHEEDLLPDSTLTLKIDLEFRIMKNSHFLDESFLFKETIGDELMIYARITSRTYDLFDESVHEPDGASDMRTEYRGKKELFQLGGFYIGLLTDDRTEEGEDVVSIHLLNTVNVYYSGVFKISIINATKKIEITEICPVSCFLLKYPVLRRTVLYDNKEDLLQDGTFTLKIDLELKVMTNFPFEEECFLYKEIIENQLIMHARVTSTTHDFLDESIHQSSKSEKTEYLGREELAECGLKVDVFPNGMTDKDKGFVSVVLSNVKDQCLRGNAILTVVGASIKKKQRERKTFAGPDTLLAFHEWYLKYVSRETLVSNSDDLLPNGTLTLRIDLMLKITNDLQDYYVLPKGDENHPLKIIAKVTSRTYDFPDESIHKPGVTDKTEYSGKDELIAAGFRLEIFPNGDEEENKGFVSILLSNETNFQVEGGYQLSVIDSSKNKQCTKKQDFFYPLHKGQSCLSRYISRKQLTSEKYDLLPDDTLTLRADLVLYRLKDDDLMNDCHLKNKSFILKKTLENHVKIFARVTATNCDFFEESILEPGMMGKTEYFGRDELFAEGCLVDVFPNGRSDENKGFVSLTLHNTADFGFHGNCDVSIIDASKNEVYNKSFDIEYPMIPSFQIEKYIAREQIAADRDNLIPDGILTLRIDLCMRRLNYFLRRTNAMDVVQVTVTSRTHNFLKEPKHLDQSESSSIYKTEYSGQEELLKLGIHLQVSVDGNQDSVFIIFHNARQHDGIFIVSVMDAFQNLRFPRTLTIPMDRNPTYREKYISRTLLLSDPADLLPSGVLTLVIEARLTLRTVDTSPTNQRENTGLKYNLFEDSVEISQDSRVAKRLAAESDYFRAMRETEMIEKITNKILFRKDELETFMYISQLLLGLSPMKFPSIKKIFDMYVFADVYIIPYVSETCMCFLKLYASVKGVDRLVEEAKLSDYVYFKELMQKLISLIRETDFDTEIDEVCSGTVCLTQPIRGCLWVYDDSGDPNNIVFSDKNVSMVCNLIDERNEYNFYQ